MKPMVMVQQEKMETSKRVELPKAANDATDPDLETVLEGTGQGRQAMEEVDLDATGMTVTATGTEIEAGVEEVEGGRGRRTVIGIVTGVEVEIEIEIETGVGAEKVGTETGAIDDSRGAVPVGCWAAQRIKIDVVRLL
jgi:hypothetical protein